MGEKAHNRIYPASAHAWNAHVEVAKKAKKRKNSFPTPTSLRKKRNKRKKWCPHPINSGDAGEAGEDSWRVKSELRRVLGPASLANST